MRKWGTGTTPGWVRFLLLWVFSCFLCYYGGYRMGEAEHEDYRILPDHAAYTTERSQRESVEAQNRSKSSVYPICVNTADSDTLQLLPQIGRKRAQDIILYRQQHGPFHSPEDLLAVEGIGESVLREIEDLISFEEEEGG